MFRLVIYDFPAIERKNDVLDILYSNSNFHALKEGIRNREDEEKFLHSFKKRADELSVARFAVERCIETKRRNGQVRYGLFTGSTSEPVYKLWVDFYSGLDYSNDITFNLDEYKGLHESHEQSYRRFMKEQLFSHLNFRPENNFFPDKLNGEYIKDGDYDMQISMSGGIDIQLAGIGVNGHIAFIEPNSSPYNRTMEVKLDPLTRIINAQKYAGGNVEEIPESAYSVGLDTLMRLTGSLYVAILGGHKAEIAKKAIEGPVTIEVPCSFAQMHSNGNFVLDGEAASKIDYRKLNPVFARGLRIEHGLGEEEITYALDSMAGKARKPVGAGNHKEHSGAEDFPCAHI